MAVKAKKRRIGRSFAESIVDVIIYSVLAILGISCVLPFIHLIAISLSGAVAVGSGKVTLWPMDFSIDAYRFAIEHPSFLRAFSISVARTVVGILISLTMLVITAYPLSKSYEACPPARIFKGMMIIAMLISGGLVPMYLVMSWIRLTNTFWALVIPGSLSLWNCFMVMNYFRSIPSELEEAAVVDGANSFQILVRVYLPLSVPIIATMAVFVGVGHWNDWFSGMLYIARSQNYPLQTYLQQVITIPDFSKLTLEEMKKYAEVNNKNNQAAQILIATIPILLIYPFLQRYFMTGLTLGGVKG
ncbi:MAG TPA: carbohydrate ABC transporter permease [Clostridiales bacterium]|nr:carbohydrate ABC transporter permease [Clostridiales bacterium]